MSDATALDPFFDLSTLPEDPVARREALEERAEPSTTRPRLSAKREALSAGLDERSRECFIGAEDLTFRLLRLAKKIRGDG